MQLDRQDLIDGLGELIRLAREDDIRGVSIRIVGGAALRLGHFDRDTTADIDAQIEPMAQLQPIIKRIAQSRGWPIDWLNNKAVMFIPTWGRAVEWEPVLDDAHASIAIAPVNALLAMKLNAARPGRDTDDIAKLLVLNDIDSVDAAENLFESFYPGDALPEKTIKLLEHIFVVGLPPKPLTPGMLDFS